MLAAAAFAALVFERAGISAALVGIFSVYMGLRLTSYRVRLEKGDKQ